MYSQELLDHFQNPRNAGEIASPDSTARLENPVCGDILELSVKLEKVNSGGSCIADIRFRAKGCVPTMACASVLTEFVKGKTVDEALRLSREELVSRLGGLPQASTHASQLALDTLAAVLRIGQPI